MKIEKDIDTGWIAEKIIAKTILPMLIGDILDEYSHKKPFDFMCKKYDNAEMIRVEVRSRRPLGGWVFKLHTKADIFLLIGFNDMYDIRLRVKHIWMIYKDDILDIIDCIRRIMPFHPVRRKIKCLANGTSLHIYDNKDVIELMSKFEVSQNTLELSNMTIKKYFLKLMI